MNKPRYTGASLCAAVGALAFLLVVASDTVSAQAPDAEERCTPDVMRLCSEFQHDRDQIVKCLKAKRRQLSASCLKALQPQGKASNKQGQR
jgi:hypothetical protein